MEPEMTLNRQGSVGNSVKERREQARDARGTQAQRGGNVRGDWAGARAGTGEGGRGVREEGGAVNGSSGREGAAAEAGVRRARGELGTLFLVYFEFGWPWRPPAASSRLPVRATRTRSAHSCGLVPPIAAESIFSCCAGVFLRTRAVLRADVLRRELCPVGVA